jgi:RNA polymerase sigma factor (sigma-70 family)
MVWRVCRRVLSHHQDAEDAFQATFLVLVRRASSILPRDMVSNWLYGVARQTSLKARAMAAKRRSREKQAVSMAKPPGSTPDNYTSDLTALLDQELSRLSDKYRVAIVLCDLKGKTRKEAARQLGLPEGTLSARLARGRAMLAKRLSRHGPTISAGTLAAAMTQNVASAGVPPAALVSSTIKVSTLVTAGEAAAAGLISVPVAALTEGVMKTMLVTKLKITTTLLLVLAVSTAGGLLYHSQAGASDDRAPGQQGKDAVREEAIKALERYAASKQEADRELAIRALTEFGQRFPSAPRASTRVRPADQTDPWDAMAGRFKHPVRFEIGYTEFRDGGRLEILEVRGTRSEIEEGGQYLVRGKYKLPPGQPGKIYFYETATAPPDDQAQRLGLPAVPWNGVSTTLDLQAITIEKESGEFTLMHGMAGPGFFHLVLADPERYSQAFANVYFGTGDNVLRKKP